MTSRRPDRIGVEKVNYDSHLARVKQAKTSVDCHAPKSHPLLNRVDVDQRRRYASIEYDNRILLARIATIIQSKPSVNDAFETSELYSTSKREITKSRKKVELQKISDENHKMLKRIQQAPSAYKVTDWDEHARVNELHKRSISAFPEYYDKIDRDISHAKCGSPMNVIGEPSIKMRSPNGYGFNADVLTGSLDSANFIEYSGRLSGEKVLPHLQGKRKTSIDKVFPDWKKKSDVLISGV